MRRELPSSLKEDARMERKLLQLCPNWENMLNDPGNLVRCVKGIMSAKNVQVKSAQLQQSELHSRLLECV